MMCVMLVMELRVPRRLRNVYISVLPAKIIGYFAVLCILLLMCEPLLLRPPYERYRAQVEYKLTLITVRFFACIGLSSRHQEGPWLLSISL